MSKLIWYAGKVVNELRIYQIFKSLEKLTQSKYGHLYSSVTGPFSTKIKAKEFISRAYGIVKNNPSFKYQSKTKKATSYERRNEEITFTLYNTPIVIVRHKEIELNTGGHFTLTTKRRMNQISKEFSLGYHVIQKKGDWHVTFRGKTFLLVGSVVLPLY